MTQDEEIASPRRCGMCGNSPCTCGSGPVYHVLVPRERLERLEAALRWYADVKNYTSNVPGNKIATAYEWGRIAERARRALAPDQGGAV